MKKNYLAFSLLLVMGACGGNNNNAAKTETAPTVSSDKSANPDYQKGLELIGKSDCLTCHKVSEKNIGPAYKDVADKYENTDANVTMLAGKIVKGGSGVWGPIPMTAHPAISEADAKQMVKYILLLKK